MRERNSFILVIMDKKQARNVNTIYLTASKRKSFKENSTKCLRGLVSIQDIDDMKQTLRNHNTYFLFNEKYRYI